MSHHHRHDKGRCKEVFARLSEYMDGELPEELCAEFDGHMEGCPPCQECLESLRKTVRLVEEQEAPAMPEDVRRAIREAWRQCADKPD